MPSLTRRGVVFAVHIPEAFEDDPSVWVEKRFGIGYTINFANKRSHWIMGGTVVLILGMLGVSLLLPFLLR